MTSSFLPSESPFWFPTAPGVTTLPSAPPIIDNEYPQPANSIIIGDDFDPENPPSDLWDVIPDDTSEVPAATQEVIVVVPVATVATNRAAVVHTNIDVERRLVLIPQQQRIELRLRTRALVRRVPVKSVTLTTYTKVAVTVDPPALRENPVECVCVIDFTVSRSNILG
jgi:hypothetical protein